VVRTGLDARLVGPHRPQAGRLSPGPGAMNRRSTPPAGRARGPLWYQDAVIYELRVRSFYDSDGDGSGDLRGLIEKLGYLQDLGVTAVWLLPFYPSPLRDDG
jgi:maltose alpha-D-glucosyltransferase / alpha-amylase